MKKLMLATAMILAVSILSPSADAKNGLMSWLGKGASGSSDTREHVQTCWGNQWGTTCFTS